MNKPTNENWTIYPIMVLIGLIVLISWMIYNFFNREYQGFFNTILDDLFNPIMWVGIIFLVIGWMGIKNHNKEK